MKNFVLSERNVVEMLLHPKKYPPDALSFPKVTNTTNGIACLYMYKKDQSSKIFFWEDISDDQFCFQNELHKIASKHFASAFPRINFNVKINPPSSWMSHFFTKALSRSSNQRIIIHYLGYGIPKIDGDSIFTCQQSDNDFFKQNIDHIIEESGMSSAFIFDCNNSGSLYKHFASSEKDIFAFFSCSPNQCNPITFGLPTDLFTSCMTSPARSALIWHSRHYYSYKSGPLRQLILFSGEEETLLEKMIASITTVLKHIVEAIAFPQMSQQMFMRLFRTDQTVSQLSVNFVLSTRIMSSLGVVPMSIPAIPGLISNPIWHSFDMWLDSELFRLKPVSLPLPIPYTSFLSQVLDTFEYLVSSLMLEQTNRFLEPISFLPSLLGSQNPDESIKDRTCGILSRYLDMSRDIIPIVANFQVLTPLLKIITLKPSKDALFCIMKIVAYNPELFAPIIGKCEYFFTSAFRNKPVILPIMTSTLLCYGSKRLSNAIVDQSFDVIARTLKEGSKIEKVWSVFLLTLIFSKHNKIITIEGVIASFFNNIDDDTEFCLVMLYCLSVLYNDIPENMIIQIFENHKVFSHHLSFAVRGAFKSFVTMIIKNGSNNIVNRIRNIIFDIYQVDEHEIIQEKQEKIILPDVLLNYLSGILDPIYDHIFGTYCPIALNDFDFNQDSQPKNCSLKISYDFSITSKIDVLRNDFRNTTLFGSNEGKLYVGDDSNYTFTPLNITHKSSVTCNKILSANNNMYFGSIDTLGEFFLQNYSDILSSFYVNPGQKSKNEWEFSILDGNMVVFAHDSSILRLFDLEREIRKESININHNAHQSLVFDSSMVVVLNNYSNKLLFIDTRQKNVAYDFNLSFESQMMQHGKDLIYISSISSDIYMFDYRACNYLPIIQGEKKCKHFDYHPHKQIFGLCSGEQIMLYDSSSNIYSESILADQIVINNDSTITVLESPSQISRFII